MRRRIMLSVALGVGALLFLVVWFLWPHGPAHPASPTEPLPIINGTPMPVWPLHSLTLIGSDRAEQEVALAKPRSAAALVICVAAEQLEGVTEARLKGAGDCRSASMR
jgi:hypothetical protein